MGSFAKTYEGIAELKSLGVRYFTYQVDAPMIKESFANVVAELQKIVAKE